MLANAKTDKDKDAIASVFLAVLVEVGKLSKRQITELAEYLARK